LQKPFIKPTSVAASGVGKGEKKTFSVQHEKKGGRIEKSVC